MRLTSTQLRQIRKCMLFVADATPVCSDPGNKNTSMLLPSPNVCVEIGYALQSKDSGQILLVKMERSDFSGSFPFDLPNQQQLLFNTAAELRKTLPLMLETLLVRFKLFFFSWRVENQRRNILR